jgi:hypothetical protein
MTDQEVGNMPLEEWPEDKQIAPPEGTMILKPFKELMQFWPNDQWFRDDVAWVDPLEQQFFSPLGKRIAEVFDVSLINDAEYISMPEDAKASFLSCVLTRSQIKEIRTGVFEWFPISVVVRYCVIAAVQTQVDRSNRSVVIPQALVWSRDNHTYIPITDPTTGRIDNPAVLLKVFTKYIEMELSRR